jgi:DNA-binding NarL/FixJ family response regulator
MQYFTEKSKQHDSYGMTPKEQEVLKLLSEGLSYKMVADRLGISFFTVNAHVKKIYDKLHVHSLSEAMAVMQKSKVI